MPIIQLIKKKQVIKISIIQESYTMVNMVDDAPVPL